MAVRDPTRRGQGAEELRRSRERYRLLVETIPHGIEELSADGTILFANPAHHRIYGYEEGELIGRSIAILAPTAGDWAKLKAYLERIVREQPEPSPWIGRGRTKDGRIIDVRVDWTYRRDPRGAVAGFVSVVTDVTEQRRGEARLRENLNLLEAILESSADAIYMKDRDGVYRLTNSAGSALVGRTPAQVLGHTDRDFFPADVAAYVRANDLRVMEEGAVLTSEDRIQTAEGARVMLSVKSPYRDGRGRVVGLVGVSRDISERKKVEEELQQARDDLERRVRERTAQLEEVKGALEADIEARKKAEGEKRRLERTLRHSQSLEAVGRLAGGVAHDFNNVLGAVLACAWSAGLPDATSEQIHRELDRIQDLCRQGGAVTRQLLAVARQKPLAATALDLSRELSQIRVLVERACPKTVSVVFDISEDLPTIIADRASLTTTLLNLCLNARDAMSSGGLLTVQARREKREGKDWAVVSVQDTGAGIPEDLQDRVFQPFFSTKLRGRGSGLGLTTAFAAAQNMGGSLALESEPGRGATFTLRVPAPAQTGEGAVAKADSAAPSGGRDPAGGAVLVVEDEEDIGRMAAQVLARSGYQALLARTGLEALEVVRDRSGELRLILLDLMLPELSGDRVHQLLKATVPEIPVVFVTASEVLAAEADAMVPLLRKPFSEAELTACVQRSARSPQRTQGRR